METSITRRCFDTPNRELSANQGRWLSPDPAGTGWNQYGYPTNPNSNIDPSGLQVNPGLGFMVQPDANAVYEGFGEFETLWMSFQSFNQAYSQWMYALYAPFQGFTFSFTNSQGNYIIANFSGEQQVGTLTYTSTTTTSDYFAYSQAANNGWQQGPDPVAVANSMRAAALKNISNCYNSSHQSAVGTAVEKGSLLALTPVATDYQNNLSETFLGGIFKGSLFKGLNVTAATETLVGNVLSTLVGTATAADVGTLGACVSAAPPTP
jgi:hypothetical protein